MEIEAASWIVDALFRKEPASRLAFPFPRHIHFLHLMDGQGGQGSGQPAYQPQRADMEYLCAGARGHCG